MGELIPLAAIIVGGALLFPVVVGVTVGRLKRAREPLPTRDHDIVRLDAELQQTRQELQRLAER